MNVGGQTAIQRAYTLVGIVRLESKDAQGLCHESTLPGARCAIHCSGGIKANNNDQGSHRLSNEAIWLQTPPEAMCEPLPRWDQSQQQPPGLTESSDKGTR